MTVLTKLALGAMGRLRPVPAKGGAVPTITLSAPDTTGGNFHEPFFALTE